MHVLRASCTAVLAGAQKPRWGVEHTGEESSSPTASANKLALGRLLRLLCYRESNIQSGSGARACFSSHCIGLCLFPTASWFYITVFIWKLSPSFKTLSLQTHSKGRACSNELAGSPHMNGT